MVKREYSFKNGKLIFECNENNWCNISFSKHSNVINLGADNLQVLVRKIINGIDFDKKKDIIGNINNVQVSWIFSLTEKHSTAYWGQDHNKNIFFFQDSNGNLIGSLDMSNEEMISFCNEMRLLLI